MRARLQDPKIGELDERLENAMRSDGMRQFGRNFAKQECKDLRNLEPGTYGGTAAAFVFHAGVAANFFTVWAYV